MVSGILNFESTIEVKIDWEVPVWIIVDVKEYPVAALEKKEILGNKFEKTWWARYKYADFHKY